MIAIVKGEVHAAFGAGEQQTFSLRIFADGVYGLILWQSSDDLLPGFAIIVSAIDIRVQIIQSKTVHGSINRSGIGMRSIHLGQLAPRRQFWRRGVLPVLAAVVCHLDQPVVGANPNQIRVLGRGSNRIDHATVLAFGRIGPDEDA